MRRIVHVIQSLDLSTGGPPVVCTRLARAQADAGNTVEIVTAGGRASETGVSVCRVNAPGVRELFLRGRCRKDLAKLVAGADILHLHGVWDSTPLAAAAEARRARIPYVVAPHGMLDPWSLAQKRWKKRFALALGVRRHLDGAEALHLLNADEQKLIAPLSLRAKPWIIPNGVSLAEVDQPANPADFRNTHPQLGADPYVLFLSRLHYKKGLDILAAAFAEVATRHPSLKLVVAGPDEGERQPFEHLVRHLRLETRTLLVGPLYGAVKWAALRGASCFCLPSRQEGFSMAVLEAMSSSVPVVLSEHCHFPEVATAGAGRVVPLTATAVAEAILELATRPDAAAEAGRAGRRMTESSFTWDRVAASCERLYAAVCRTMESDAINKKSID